MTHRSLMLAGGAAMVLGAILAVWFWNQRVPEIDGDDPAQISAGREIYFAHCSTCHGETLDGELGWPCRKASGHLCAPPLNASSSVSIHLDRDLFRAVKHGKAGTDMPAYRNRIADDDIAAVLAFVKSTWTQDMRAHQERLSR